MTKQDKLVRKLCGPPPVEASFEEVRALLEDFGWALDRESGSHATFVKPGEYHINVPKVGGRKVKGGYLRRNICERLGLL